MCIKRLSKKVKFNFGIVEKIEIKKVKSIKNMSLALINQELFSCYKV